MHQRASEFAERAHDRYGVDVEVLEFDASTKTAAAAAEAVGCETAAIASTIVVELSDSDRDSDAGARRVSGNRASPDDLVAAITSGANRLDLDAVAEHFGASSAVMGDPERIREVIGWSIGGVPPICHDETVPTVMDPALEAFETVYGAAGTPSAVFPIAPDRLADLADATVVDLTEP
ncbi:YbaK/EbsC family protein [Halorubrum sp. 48-1-W]|uniref:YbaK/EbsC family protein n=1 Tax=Halorubrum sp. 48-1-W TaxID=2249761 RepID=UPI000DCBF417|nr:YbaK/EbsC family protein [Halorubrum sp. 48-1-W]RAW46165.1 YbaK/EbsC family protein [Halorubrum sp. 48-1-W]